MPPPLISVLISVYNAEQTIKLAIDSILQQTLENIELIVINDGSTDDTPEILADYRDERLIVINQHNRGLTKSLIYAASFAKGKYLARQDADDTSFPYRLEKQFYYLEKHPEIALLGTASQQVDSENVPLGEIIFPTSYQELRKGLADRNQFVHGSIMMRKTVYELVGGYREAFQYSQDYDLFLRIAEQFQVENLSEVLYRSTHNLNMLSLTHKEDQVYFSKCAKILALQRQLTGEDQLDKQGVLPDIPHAKNEDYTIIYYRHLISSFLRQGNIKKLRENGVALLKNKPIDGHTWLILMLSLFGKKVTIAFVSILDKLRSLKK